MKQQRNTGQRQLVLDAVRARYGQSGCGHPTADQVCQDVRAADGRISRGTVYRNLNFPAEHGRLPHVAAPQADRFDARLDFHYHLLCIGMRHIARRAAGIPGEAGPNGGRRNGLRARTAPHGV